MRERSQTSRLTHGLRSPWNGSLHDMTRVAVGCLCAACPLVNGAAASFPTSETSRETRGDERSSRQAMQSIIDVFDVGCEGSSPHLR